MTVSADVKKKIAANTPLPFQGHYSKWQARNYYYFKSILSKQDRIVSNIIVAQNEMNKSRKKLDALYPDKMLAKLVDTIAGSTEVKEKRRMYERILSTSVYSDRYAYLTKDAFAPYSAKIIEAMRNRDAVSPDNIKEFDGLKDLGIQLPIGQNKNQDWSTYFIIQALKPLVDEGVFEDLDLSDGILDNHIYRYTKSNAPPMPSIDASSDPRFALD